MLLKKLPKEEEPPEEVEERLEEAIVTDFLLDGLANGLEVVSGSDSLVLGCAFEDGPLLGDNIIANSGLSVFSRSTGSTTGWADWEGSAWVATTVSGTLLTRLATIGLALGSRGIFLYEVSATGVGVGARALGNAKCLGMVRNRQPLEKPNTINIKTVNAYLLSMGQLSF